MVVGVLLEISIQEERHEVASYQSAAKITPPETPTTIRCGSRRVRANEVEYICSVGFLSLMQVQIIPRTHFAHCVK